MHIADRFSPRERRSVPEYLADRRIVFCVAYFGYAVCYLVRNNFRLASSQLGSDLELTTVEIGVILSFFSVSYGCGKLVMGILVDRTSMRFMLTVALFGSSITCLLIPFANSPIALKTLLSILGVLQGAGAPACLAMLNSWYPNASRGAAVSIWNTSQNLGAAALAACAAWILSEFGDWRLLFWIPASLALVLLLPLCHHAKDRPWREGYPTLTEMYGRAGVPSLPIQPEESYWQLVWQTIRTSPALIILVALNALLYFIRFGVINWMVSYLPDEKEMALSESQSLFGLLELAAIPFVGLFALLAFRAPARMSNVGMWSMGILAVGLLGYSCFSAGPALRVSVVVIGGLIYAPQVIVNILTLNLTPPRMVGAAIGIVGLSGYLMGELGANLILPHFAWDAVYPLLALAALLAGGMYRVLRPYELRAVVVD